MKRKQKLLHIIIFFSALILPTFLWAVFRVNGVAERLDYDTNEKRNKHEIAQDAGLNAITSEIEQYYDDRIPFRSVLLSAERKLDHILEFPYDKLIEPALLTAANAGNTEKKDINPETNKTDPEKADTPAADNNTAAEDWNTLSAAGPEPPVPSSDGYYPYTVLDEGVVEGRDGWLFFEATTPDYMCSNLFAEEELVSLKDRMVTLRDICAQKGIEVHYIFFPNKNTVYPEFMPSIEKGEYSRALQLEEYIRSNTDLSCDYVYDEMLTAKEEHQLYRKQDSHWNTFGALAAINVLYPMLGLSPVSLSELAPVPRDGGLGDLVYLTGLVESYDPETEWDPYYKADIYQTVNFWHNDALTYEEAVSAASDDRTLTIVGDSFNFSLTDYLACDFSNLYYLCWYAVTELDPSPILNADILIVDNVERNLGSLGATLDSLIAIYSQ